MGEESARSLSVQDAPALLDLMARLGLASYVGLIDDPEPSLRLVQQDAEAAARRAGLDRSTWPEQRAALMARWRRAPGKLPILSARLALNPADLFLLGLIVTCERRRTVALAVTALQAPFASASPSVHLALDMIHVLFEAELDDAIALAASPLIDSGLVALEGTDALPQRVLSIRLPLWRALSAGAPAWPGCRPLAGAPAEASGIAATVLAGAAHAIAAGEAGGVVFRGPPGSGRGVVAAAFARLLDMTPIEVALATFREDRGFATACRIARWLPVLRLEPGMGDLAILGGPGDLPVAVLAGAHGAVQGERLIELAMAPPAAPQRIRLWETALGEGAIDRAILTGAVLYPGMIEAVGRTARIRAETESRPIAAADLAAARLALASDGLGRLAHPVIRSVGADALVTTPALAADLQALIGRCRQRETIWDGLGPSLQASATRGVRALFAGESGTGKTMAAAYIATALAAPLYRCDLAAVMNKYIGESEKNLASLLDHAEAVDVVLLFDEADALFGRRTEGGETGERYANMLTNYLLTRLEAHNGIVILTANAKARIDPAFWRRLDHVIDFPTPGYEQRLTLWKSHLGHRAPPEATLERLAAYCDLPGGSIRNAVLAAAALALPNAPIGFDSLSPALQREYTKLRRALPAGLALAMRGGE
jgi:ATPase family associated with various cellular activities (AAA)